MKRKQKVQILRLYNTVLGEICGERGAKLGRPLCLLLVVGSKKLDVRLWAEELVERLGGGFRADNPICADTWVRGWRYRGGRASALPKKRSKL